ncbi:related to microfibril-associated protein [Fusarium torulosum]|uniref:Related to microfibril-associated protein n=1 Tax=Fusarium torulosum TaxID=33205 RepID=A0AAE8M4V3_9HYPO|nr:related to microfibril-associated protein [Fusarium torulosum]
MPPKRMTANPVKPARYRAGKATGVESDSDSEASENEESVEPALPPPPKATSAGKISSGNLGKVDLNARRKEAEAAEERRLAKEKAERLAAEEGFVTEEEEESEEEEDDDEEEESESEEESSEEEAPRRLMIRPKFVPKSQRGTKDPAELEEEARQAEEEARKKAADELVEEQIKKDLAARSAGKKHWDDDENEESDVDTTDGLDPEAEEAAWRVRELKRLKRARAIIEEREKELAEVERRRNLTEEERQAEDEAFLAHQKEEKDGKGKMSFMQRYLHKGAFYQDEMKAAGLDKRDIMGSRIQDDVRNREALPEYLQRRDMAKLGRKGATKYRDMRTEDTGRWGDIGGGRKRDGRFEEDERFKPDDDRFRRDERSAGGANAIPLGDRKKDDHGDKDSGSRDRRDRDSYRSRDDGDSRRRSQSRSRSPRRDRDRDDYRRRKRSTSRDDERYDSDKRRKVDAR